MTAKFTRGPWSCDLEKYEGATDAVPGSIYGADGFEVASTQGAGCRHIERDRDEGKHLETIEREDAIERANAALITAAPDLYAVLQRCERSIPKACTALRRDARAALVKARRRR
jgi:hypothetical protein